jgi:uncharacterized protein YneF (UPF0154 family)
MLQGDLSKVYILRYVTNDLSDNPPLTERMKYFQVM